VYKERRGGIGSKHLAFLKSEYTLLISKNHTSVFKNSRKKVPNWRRIEIYHLNQLKKLKEGLMQKGDSSPYAKIVF